MTTYNETLRHKFGYMVPTTPPSPVIGLLQKAGTRPRPLNRAYPARSTYCGDCPFCGREDACYVEPDGETWMTVCGCSTGGGLMELMAALIITATAA